ncbi:MAG: DUF3783 domain-containing protein [Pseudoflavonifractor sp.]|nr:DUF3783 domain-containing protein [Pseudoflavonifractor sp.]
MPKQVLLCYEPAAQPWGASLRKICAVQGLRFRSVETADLGRTVGALAEGMKAAEEGESHPALPEPVLVFCGVGSAQLDRLLQALRKLGLPRTCLKAVLTGENAGWSFFQLYQELTQERSALS